MNAEQHDRATTEFLTAVYEVNGSEKEARARAERICLDQTIEAEADLLAPPLRGKIVGHLERVRRLSAARYEAVIRYAGDLVGKEHSDLLNLVFGTSSLRQDVRLVSFSLTHGLLSSWKGPRYGIAGLRRAVGVADRPLACAVLKPLGRSPAELAKLAAHCVRGGADLIKDDQALLDQRFCPFSERVGRCAQAIAEASSRRGRPCLYFAHVSGAADTMRLRAREAKRLGATGLLIGPGLTGFDALRAVAEDEELALPIASHPAFLGTCASRGGGGLAPAVAYALLPRLAGADMAIYPSFDAGYNMPRNDGVSVAVNCRQAWHHVRPSMPAVGGRISADRIDNVIGALGQDIVFVLGSWIQENERGVVAALERFQRALAQSL